MSALESVAEAAAKALPDLISYVARRIEAGRSADEAADDARLLFTATTAAVDAYEAEAFRGRR